MSINDLPMVHWIMQALACGTEGVGNLLIGDLNTCLENTKDQKEEQLATLLPGHVLTYQ